MTTKSVRLLKKHLRREIQSSLKLLTDSEISQQSSRCASTLFQLPEYVQSRNISIYLSMPTTEIQTQKIVENAFYTGKRVFVPFIDGPIMQMVESKSVEEVTNFRPNSWGIPEPDTSSISQRGDALEGEGLDIVLLPGVGFDHQMNRIGHGKGYYDHFIQRCHDYAKKVGREPPALVALALKEQIVEDGRIPMTDADWKMDIIIADGEIIKPTVH